MVGMGHRRRVEVVVDMEGDGWMAVTLEASHDKGAYHGMLLMEHKRVDVPGYLSKDQVEGWKKKIEQEEKEAEKAKTAGPSPSSAKRGGNSEISDEELSMTSARSTTNCGKPSQPRTRFRRAGPRGVWVKGNRTRPSLCTKCRNPTTQGLEEKTKKKRLNQPEGSKAVVSAMGLGKRPLEPSSGIRFTEGRQELRNPSLSPLKTFRLGRFSGPEGSSTDHFYGSILSSKMGTTPRSPGRRKNSSLATLFPVRNLVTNKFLVKKDSDVGNNSSTVLANKSPSLPQSTEEVKGISLNAPLHRTIRPKLPTGSGEQLTRGLSVPVLKIRMGSYNQRPVLIRRVGAESRGIQGSTFRPQLVSNEGGRPLSSLSPAPGIRVGITGPFRPIKSSSQTPIKSAIKTPETAGGSKCTPSEASTSSGITRKQSVKKQAEIKKEVKSETEDSTAQSPPPYVPTTEENPEGLKVGDIVWAKMPREPYWPAEIFAFNASEDTCVLWLGSSLHGFVPLLSLQRFNDAFKKRYNPKRTSRNYQSAVVEGIMKMKKNGVRDDTFYQSLSPLAVKIMSEKSSSSSSPSTPKRGRGRGKGKRETKTTPRRHTLPASLPDSEEMSEEPRCNDPILLEQVFSPTTKLSSPSTSNRPLPSKDRNPEPARSSNASRLLPGSVSSESRLESPKRIRLSSYDQPQPSQTIEPEAGPSNSGGFASAIEMEEYESEEEEEEEEELGAEEWKGAVEAAANAIRPPPPLSPQPPDLSPNNNTGEKDYEEAMSELEAMNRLCPASPPSNPSSIDPSSSSVLAH